MAINNAFAPSFTIHLTAFESPLLIAMSTCENANDKATWSVKKRIWDSLCSPGRQYAVRAAAPTQSVVIGKSEASVFGEYLPESMTICESKKTKSMGSRFFDSFTSFAGSRFTFVSTLAVLLGWAIAGIVLGAPANWQIAIQDGGSIQCYISDSLLMRQQHNQCNKLLTIIAQLRSRNITYKRILRNPQIVQKIHDLKINLQNLQTLEDNIDDAVKLPLENWFDKLCNWVSLLVPHFNGVTCGSSILTLPRPFNSLSVPCSYNTPDAYIWSTSKSASLQLWKLTVS
ncbi:low-affinity Fe(2+) transport protein [Basidiobolus ranarum]|uniref:Low-affinity Fe(2+) transport protein n=1 Tax=Basidiobolus ranarum TaxID=34480 RepID=A0ABR2WJ64_9FUNG